MTAVGAVAVDRLRGRARSQAWAGSADLIVVAVATAAALVVRLVLWHGSLFEDEQATYSVVAGHGLGTVLHLQRGHSNDLTPPLYDVLAWLSVRLGFTREMLRLPSLIAGVAAVPLTYLLGRRVTNRSAAAAAAVFLALCPFEMYYGTQARPYALVMALALACSLALVCAVESGRVVLWGLYAVLAAAATYTHFSVIFLLVAQGAWVLIRFPEARRRLVIASAVSIALFSPWIAAVIRDVKSPGASSFSIIEPFTSSAVAHDLEHWALGGPWTTLGAVPSRPAVALVVAGILVAVVGWLTDGRRLRGGHWRLFPLVLAGALPVGLALYSVIVKDVWDPRNLISSSPGLALVAGRLVTGGVHGRWIKRLTPSLLLTAGLAVGVAMMLRPVNGRPQYQAAVDRVIADGSSSDPVAVIQAPGPGPLSSSDAAFAYAHQSGRPLLRIGAAPISKVLAAPPYALLPATSAEDLAAQAASTHASKLWVLAPGTASARSLARGGPFNDRSVLGPVFGSGRLGELMGTTLPQLSAFVRAVNGRFAFEHQWQYGGMLRLSLYEYVRRG